MAKFALSPFGCVTDMDVAASFVARYLGYTGPAPAAGPSGSVQLQADGSTISGLATVASYMAAHSSSPAAAALQQGVTPELQAQVRMQTAVLSRPMACSPSPDRAGGLSCAPD